MIKCPKHPKYKGLRMPIAQFKNQNKTKDCWCFEIWEAKQDGLNLTWIVNPDGTKHLVEG